MRSITTIEFRNGISRGEAEGMTEIWRKGLIKFQKDMGMAISKITVRLE